MSIEFPSPRPVAEGSVLAIVAPSGPFNVEAFDNGVCWLSERYDVRYDSSIYTKSGYFAGDDNRRASELIQAIDDPEVDAILCARGGYGATRLLPNLEVHAVKQANKLLVGFSDVTALHSLWARAGVRSIHAPMVAALATAPDDIREQWITAIEQPSSGRQWTLDSIQSGSAEGRLFGGNLAVLVALLGTPFVPPLEDCILFLEDVGERPYRIDRMLTTLSQAGWFDQVSGIVLGSFTEGDPGADGISIEDVMTERFGNLDIPVLSGLPAGHIKENEPLVFGSAARIEATTLKLGS